MTYHVDLVHALYFYDVTLSDLDYGRMVEDAIDNDELDALNAEYAALVAESR